MGTEPVLVHARAAEQAVADEFLSMVAGIEGLVQTIEACQAVGGDAKGTLSRLVQEKIAEGGDVTLWTIVQTSLMML